MKIKIYWFLLTFCLVACATEQMPLLLSIDKTKFSESDAHSIEKVMTSTLQNTTNRTATVEWDFAKETEVTDWTYQIKINGTLQSGISGSFDMEAAEEVTLSVTINPNGKSGTSSATLTLLEGSTQLGTIEYAYTTSAGPKFSLSTTVVAGNSTNHYPGEMYKTMVTNLTNAPLELSWTSIQRSGFPTGWWHLHKDFGLGICYAIHHSSRELAPNISFEFGTGIETYSIPGSGSVITYFYEPMDSAGTVQTFTATHTH